MAEDYSGSDPSDSSYHHQGSEAPLYGRHSSEVAAPHQYEQHQYGGGYGYQHQYPVTSGDSSGGGLYADLQGPYTRAPAISEYQHYPLSPSHHIPHQQHQQLRNYECTIPQPLDHHAGVDTRQHHQSTPPADHHEMNYGGQQHRGAQPQRPNPRQQAHGQLQAQSAPSGYPAPSGHYGSPVHAHLGVHSYPSSQQQWSDYSATQSPRVISSPVSPSPAHTPTPPIVSSGVPLSSPTSQPVHSPPLLPSHSRTPTPTSGVPPTGAMSGQYPAHHHHPLGPGGSSQSHALSWGHPNVSSQSQAIGLHQSGRPSTNSISPQPHNFYTPTMSSAARGPQPLTRVTGGSPPPTVHSPPTTTVRCAQPWGAAHGGQGASEGTRMAATKAHASGGPGNPLASLQLLVDQDMNRGGGGIPSTSPYRGAVPPNAHSASPSSIDLSSTKTGTELGIAAAPSIHSPRSLLSFSDGAAEGVRNGNTHGASSPAPLRPPVLNGEASSGGDSGIGSPSVGGGAPTPTPPPDSASPIVSVRTGNLRDGGGRAKVGNVGPDVEYIHNVSSHGGEIEPLPLVASGRRQTEEVADLSRSGQARSAEIPQSPGEGSSISTSGGNVGRTKVIALKRTKKVDAILENLVESGSKKLATGGNERASPVALVTTSPATVAPETSSATVIAPTVVVSAPPAPPPIPSPIPAASGEESASVSALTPEGPSSAPSHSPDSPSSQSPESSPRKTSQPIPKSPSRGGGSADIEEEAVSPTFDDAQGGDKPRRKRKPDNPLRLKTPDTEGPASSTLPGKSTPPISISSKESSSSEDSGRVHSQETVEVMDPPKVESGKEAQDIPETISEISKAVMGEVKTEKDSDTSLSTTIKDTSSTVEKLSSPKAEVVEPKREKTTPKTKAEQKYVYRQYEQEVTILPKKLDLGADNSENARKAPADEIDTMHSIVPSVSNAQKDSLTEIKKTEMKEESQTTISSPSSVLCLKRVNPALQSTSVKVEEMVFGSEDTALDKVVKKPDSTSNPSVAKMEAKDAPTPMQPENKVNPLKSKAESLVTQVLPKDYSPVKAEVKNTFSEVEDQLAMMFAGIIEPEEGQQSKPVTQIPAFVEKEESVSQDCNNIKIVAETSVVPSATQEVHEALSTPPSIGRKIPRGRPKSMTGTSAGETSCGSIEGSPRKRKRKRFPEDEGDDFESSTPRKTKKVKTQGLGNPDTSLTNATAGSEGEGSAAVVSTSESTPNTTAKRKKKRKKIGSDSKYSVDLPREVPKKRVVVAEERQPRGPYIRVEGPRDGPRRVTVVNVGSRGGGGLGEDDEGGDRGGARARGRRKLGVGAKVAKDGNRGGARAAVQAGADASQPDRTWVCVFCRRGSHYGGLGDLFGPYFIGKDAPEDETADDAEKNDRLEVDVGDGGNKSGKGRRSSGAAEAVGCKSGKKQSKRRWSMTASSPGFLPGTLDGAATPASPSGRNGENGGSGRLEVWMHEECAVWAAGLYQIGSRIVGLNEAVWSSAKMMCVECGIAGANVGCVRRGCVQHLHYPCARDHGWQLDEEEFLATCPPHRKGSKSPASVLPT